MLALSPCSAHPAIMRLILPFFAIFAIMDIFLIGGKMKYIANIHNTYLITCILDFEEKAPNDRKDNGGKEDISNRDPILKGS